MAAKPFEVGDRVRVRARVRAAPVPPGTPGTITRVYSSLADVYDVAFDGSTRHQMTPGHLLKHIDESQEPTISY
jgi:hypothetical protein